MTPWNDHASDQDFLAAASECPYTCADECALAQERRLWEGPGWPCREHGGWCEVCEEFRVIVAARSVEALICADCAATEPEIEEEETR